MQVVFTFDFGKKEGNFVPMMGVFISEEKFKILDSVFTTNLFN